MKKNQKEKKTNKIGFSKPKGNRWNLIVQRLSDVGQCTVYNVVSREYNTFQYFGCLAAARVLFPKEMENLIKYRRLISIDLIRWLPGQYYSTPNQSHGILHIIQFPILNKSLLNSHNLVFVHCREFVVVDQSNGCSTHLAIKLCVLQAFSRFRHHSNLFNCLNLGVWRFIQWNRCKLLAIFLNIQSI